MTIDNINKKTAILINRDGMGVGDKELTNKLITNYLSLILSEERKPAYICLYADGVKLAIKDSVCIEQLKELESSGVIIMICKTCINHYKIEDKIEIGTVGTMLDIIDIQHNCTKLITI